MINIGMLLYCQNTQFRYNCRYSYWFYYFVFSVDILVNKSFPFKNKAGDFIVVLRLRVISKWFLSAHWEGGSECDFNKPELSGTKPLSQGFLIGGLGELYASSYF